MESSLRLSPSGPANITVATPFIDVRLTLGFRVAKPSLKLKAYRLIGSGSLRVGLGLGLWGLEFSFLNLLHSIMALAHTPPNYPINHFFVDYCWCLREHEALDPPKP